MSHLQPLFDAWLAERAAVKASRVKFGMRGYAFLAAMLRDKPMTVRELGQAAQLGHVAAYRCVLSLHTMGQAHIVDWRVKPFTRPLPVFTFGPGVDVPPPTARPNGRSTSITLPKARVCAAVIAFVHLLRAVEKEPRRRLELIELSGLARDTVQAWMDACLQLELVHVACWHMQDHGGPSQPMLLAGHGINARKPRTTKRERRERQTEQARARRIFKPLLAVFGMAANEERRAA